MDLRKQFSGKMAASDQPLLLRDFKQRENIFVQFYKSKPTEYYIVKFVFGAIFGAAMGYGFYKMAISGVFLTNEIVIRWIVASAIVGLTSFGCAASVQCRCVAVLCLPAMLGATGRRVLHAILATWILAGPISNIMYHGGEVVRSMTCIARIQVRQMSQLVHLLHAPLTAGFLHISEVAALLNETEERLNMTVNRMEKKLWYDQTSDADDDLKRDGNVAGKIRSDTMRRCTDMFEHGINECVRLFRQKEQDCHNTIKIPIVKDLLCLVMKSTFLCNVIGYYNDMCQEMPVIPSKEVNENYKNVDEFPERLKKEFDADLKWKVPHADQRTGVVTVEEIADQVENDFQEKKQIFDFATAIIRKLVAVSFVLVISAAASYNYKYLTDIRFDNLYVTTYFQRKDKERKKQGKRHLLPLTRIEKRNLVYTISLKLTTAERKAVLFKVLNLIGQIIYTGLLLLLDYLVFYVLDLIRRHGRIDAFYSGKHKLEVSIEGNRSVALLLKQLFEPYEDNEVILDSYSSNLDCLPRTEQLSMSYILWIFFGYAALVLTTWLDAYSLRLRHVVASIAYRRREKGRIVMLYNDVLRRRKNQLFHIRMTVKKLARKNRLNQRHSFWAVIRAKFPAVQKCFDLLRIGKLRCLICEESPPTNEKLIVCENEKCKIRYCMTCWNEVGGVCWACEHSRPKRKSNDEEDYEELSEQDLPGSTRSSQQRRKKSILKKTDRLSEPTSSQPDTKKLNQPKPSQPNTGQINQPTSSQPIQTESNKPYQEKPSQPSLLDTRQSEAKKSSEKFRISSDQRHTIEPDQQELDRKEHREPFQSNDHEEIRPEQSDPVQSEPNQLNELQSSEENLPERRSSIQSEANSIASSEESDDKKSDDEESIDEESDDEESNDVKLSEEESEDKTSSGEESNDEEFDDDGGESEDEESTKNQDIKMKKDENEESDEEFDFT